MASDLLAERLEDLSEDMPGNVRAHVSECLSRAADKLFAYERGEGSTDELGIAPEDVQRAIATLELLKVRLERLYQAEDKRWWKENGERIRAGGKTRAAS